MIAEHAKHTQVGSPMKGKVMTPKTTRPRRSRALTLALNAGAACLLLPFTAGLSAQTTFRWDSNTPASPNQDGLSAVYSPLATMRRVYPGTNLRVMPVAAAFDVREFEALAQGLVDSGKTPGLAMAIVQGGRIVSARGYGVTDRNNPEDVDIHTVFRLASLSKSFASTVTAQMVADGKLRWDSRPLQYIPTLQFADPNAAPQLTVADVLSHRVGIGHNAFDRDLEANAEYPMLMQKLAYAPMKCAPGECYAYQNIAYSLVGNVVESVSGLTYEQAVARRLFRPLGMFDASYGLEGIAASKRWAKPHIGSGRSWTPVYPKPTYYRVAPAAGVNASISDMAKWLLAQGGYRGDVLPGSLLATLHAPLIDTPSEMGGSAWRRQRLNAAGYALGWRVYDYIGHRMVFHGGAVQGYRGAMALLPERDVGVVVLWNSTSSAPSGLLPTILDRAIGITPQRWLDVEPKFDADNVYASEPVLTLPDAGETEDSKRAPSGVEASVSNAQPD
jgi:beta-lactamase class C